MSVSNLRLVPPLPPGAAPSPLVATTEERTVVTRRRRLGIVAGSVVGLALAAALSIGLAGRHPATPSAPPKAAQLPVAPTARAVAGEPAAPAPARQADDRAEAALPPRAADDDLPRAEADDATAIPEAPAAHRRRGGRTFERATSAKHERAAGARKRARGGLKVASSEADRHAAREAYDRGNAALLSGNAGDAAAAYAEAVRLAPAEPVGYRGLGLAYEKQGKVKDAIASFVSYLKLSHHARDREVIARRLYRLTHAQP